MSYIYYQVVGGDEAWKPVSTAMIESIGSVMFQTILAVDSPVGEDFTKEQYAGIKYKGPLYFDLDDAESPASTAVFAVELIDKLIELGVSEKQLHIFASGSKGFHILVPEECVLAKPPKTGMTFLPAIFKEMAFKLAVESLDLRVYTARKGRMLRCPNVQRDNGLYKVPLTYGELVEIANLAGTDAPAGEAMYRTICSAPRPLESLPREAPTLSHGLMALFDECKTKVSKGQIKAKKAKKVNLPASLPSWDAMLRGEGIKDDVGFHPLALQIAITAHTREMALTDLLTAAEGLINNHESDGFRYNTPAKRRAEIARMYDYTDDNPCYAYGAGAMVALLSHAAPDLRGLEVTAEEIQAGIENPGTSEGDEYEHAGIILTGQGAFTMTENGPKQVLAMGFENVTELRSAETGTVTVLEADLTIGGRQVGRRVMELDTFNSVAGVNKLAMPYGQAFTGSELQGRGLYMRLVERARRTNNCMYTVAREGLDIVSMPFHEDEEIRRDFLVWSDQKAVTPEAAIREKGVQLRFVGFPTAQGQFQSDLSQAPRLSKWVKESDENFQLLREVVRDLLTCQDASYLGKLLGWMVACHYRMLFHRLYSKFPLLHINGAAGMGKCFAKGTPIMMHDGKCKPVEDVQVEDFLMGPDGMPRKVLSLGRGQEAMYRVSQVYGDDYVVNESHILALKASSTRGRRLADGRVVYKGEAVNLTVKDYLQQNETNKSLLKGYKPGSLPFKDTYTPVPAYMLGSWLGDGKSARVMLCKPKTTKLFQWWQAEAEARGLKATVGNSGTCDTLYIGGNIMDDFRSLGVIDNKHIPDAYKYGNEKTRCELLAGLIDADGTVNGAGLRFDSAEEKLAKDVLFIARSLGLRATITTETYSNLYKTDATIHHVYITGAVHKLPTLDKVPAERKHEKDPLVGGITVTPEGMGDYYGFTIDGDHLFLLGDFTVAHNTEMTKLFARFHYYLQEPKMLTPTSTLFAVSHAASGSASIPLILDEFKPSEMSEASYHRFKLMLRDAYNCRPVERGGGNRENSDYRAVHTTHLSAPICFIAESVESEPALMERVVLLTLSKPPVIQAQKYLARFQNVTNNGEILGMVGAYMAASIVQKYSVQELEKEFTPLYNETRRHLMLQEGEGDELTQDQLSKKSGAKERTVYNYAVARFGLTKFSKLIESLFPGEFSTTLQAMMEGMYSTVTELQEQTQPEWLKVLNTFADLAQSDPTSPYYLRKGTDYAFVQQNGKDCIEIYARSCYMKYRAYQNFVKTRPLFPNDSSFIHAINTIPALVSKGKTVELNSPGGSHVLDLDELRGAGFITPDPKK